MADRPDRKLSVLPDEHACYVPGVAEVTLGEVRASSGVGRLVLDDDEFTIRHMVRLCTKGSPSLMPATLEKKLATYAD